MKILILLATLTLYASSVDAGSLNSSKRASANQSPPVAQPTPYQFTDEEFTAINAISRGKCKPTVRQIVAHAKKAMVWITALDENHQPVMHGTGFFIDDGCGVLTNYHVIEKGKYFEAEIIGSGKKLAEGYVDDSNRACDLAMLRFRGFTDGWKNINDRELDLHQLYLADDSNLVQEGDRVIVVGNPEGFWGTVTEGLVSSIRMRGALFQISAPISAGSSGSPVFNEDGYVIGIATMSLVKGQNLNFAITSNIIYDALGLMRGPGDHHEPGAGPSKGLNIISLQQDEQAPTVTTPAQTLAPAH